MKLVPALTAMAAFALVACGHVGGNAVVPTPVRPPIGALTPWASFPADHKPRPIVWLGTPVDGYATSAAKMAAYCNKYTLGSVLPTTIPIRTVATWSDGTSAIY